MFPLIFCVNQISKLKVDLKVQDQSGRNEAGIEPRPRTLWQAGLQPSLMDRKEPNSEDTNQKILSESDKWLWPIRGS